MNILKELICISKSSSADWKNSLKKIPDKLKLECYFQRSSCFLVLSCKIENSHLEIHDTLKLLYSFQSKIYWQRSLGPRKLDIHQWDFQYTRRRGSRSQLIHALLEIELWEEMEACVSPLFNTYILSTWKILKQIIFEEKKTNINYLIVGVKIKVLALLPFPHHYSFAKHIWVSISRCKFFCRHGHKPKYDHLVL